ncbi:unnamed protein product [Caenorhabditis auriculariae]|uniref:rRNA adenine N(6)-methyltransferase n=1 Tax=Caenorhabditis auriculariae TaxID=2777116 RepID=A0A8S1HA96_9PELO|nr:unnamed protein product [Caenorhabditis auriculariae]
MYRLQAKKILSQNYIMDMNVNRKIVRHAGVKPGDWVVEIGPGPGGITRGILEAGAGRLDVVEIDSRFIPPLTHLAEAAENRMYINHNDALKCEIGDLWKDSPDRPSSENWLSEPPNMHVIGNLPFNIASPLIIKYLRDMSYRRGIWAFGRVPLTLTFQLEVARRICSPIACDSRSRISIMAQYISMPKIAFEISGSCFVPRPDVDVGVVRFEPRKSPLIDVPFEVIEKVCRQVFHYRQKHMIKGLKTLYPEEIADDLAHEVLRECRIDPTTTSIRLGVEQFGDIARIYYRQCLNMPGLFPYDYTKKRLTVAELAKKSDSLPPPMQNFPKAELPREGCKLRDFAIS